jgi:hypothetical protein
MGSKCLDRPKKKYEKKLFNRYLIKKISAYLFKSTFGVNFLLNESPDKFDIHYLAHLKMNFRTFKKELKTFFFNFK